MIPSSKESFFYLKWTVVRFFEKQVLKSSVQDKKSGLWYFAFFNQKIYPRLASMHCYRIQYLKIIWKLWSIPMLWNSFLRTRTSTTTTKTFVRSRQRSIAVKYVYSHQSWKNTPIKWFLIWTRPNEFRSMTESKCDIHWVTKKYIYLSPYVCNERIFDALQVMLNKIFLNKLSQ